VTWVTSYPNCECSGPVDPTPCGGLGFSKAFVAWEPTTDGPADIRSSILIDAIYRA